MGNDNDQAVHPLNLAVSLYDVRVMLEIYMSALIWQLCSLFPAQSRTRRPWRI